MLMMVGIASRVTSPGIGAVVIWVYLSEVEVMGRSFLFSMKVGSVGGGVGS